MNDANASNPKRSDQSRQTRSHGLFLSLIDLPEHQRKAKLHQSCGDDRALLEAVEALLAADSKAQRFLESPMNPLGTAVPGGESFSSDVDPMVGKIIDDFVIETRIGKGGMGVVYAARQKRPERKVAIKVVRDALVSDKISQRLVFESEILSRLQHPHVAQIYTAGTIAGTVGQSPYFAMEYVEGARSVTSFCKAHELGLPERLDLFLAACSAVQHGHERGVIHRDLKPSNVLVDDMGKVKVIDFGIARVAADDAQKETLLTQPGLIMGSLPYMAPEQCTGGAHFADARSDVYALGAILYELLCDAPVFDVSTKSLEASLRAIRESTPVDPHRHESRIDRDLESIVLRTLAKEPEHRYDSVAQLAEDLNRYVRHEPVLAGHPGRSHNVRLFFRRNPTVSTLAAILALTLVVATAVTTSMYVMANRAREAMLDERDEAVAARQRAEASRVEAVALSDFFTETLASIDPAQAKGSEPTVRELLAGAAAKIDDALADQPLAEARLRHVIGKTYYLLGDREIAETQLRRSLDLTHAQLGADDLDYAERAQQLAALLWNTSKYTEAERWLRAALTARQRLLGEDHRDTVDVRSALATVLSSAGRDDEAEPVFRAAIMTYRKLYPKGHPILARTLNGLGMMLLKRDQPSAAEPLIREAAEMVEQHLGLDHPYTNITRMNYANVLQALSQHGLAAIELDDVLEAFLKLYGENHILVATCLEKQVITFEALGDEERRNISEARVAAIRTALAGTGPKETD